nr:hypothetical protein [Tanacetum cinerariifolium]
MSDNIPFDIQIDIMNRLPEKSLLQFRVVSKQWKFSIDSFDFIRNYGCRVRNTCCFNLSYRHNNQGYINPFDENFGFRNFDSNLNVFTLKPVASSEGSAIHHSTPSKSFLKLLGFSNDNKPIVEAKIIQQCLRKMNLDVNFLLKEERVRLLISSLGSSLTPSGSSSPNSYSSGTTTPQNHHLGTSISGGCSNYKHLLAKIKVLDTSVEMYMHPEQHTRNSTTLFHELYNDMDNLGLEYFVIWIII